jgi:hypothetical protein
MKTNFFKRAAVQKMIWMIGVVHVISIQQLTAQLCSSPGTTIYGLNNLAEVYPINVNTGAVGTRVTPANSGTAPSMANGAGYNPLSQRLYYFKRNINPAPQEFVEYNPLTNAVVRKANCSSASLINIGTCSADGLGYYCIDAFGILHYYRIASNSWVTINSNVRNQYGTTLRSIISSNAIPNNTDKVYGDMAIDGSGNMWIVISGPTTLGLYKLPAPLPTNAVGGTVTITEIIPPNNPSPGLQSIGGVAFTTTGEMYISTNSPDNRLYRLEKNLSVTFLATMSRDGVGNDLTSCSYPMFVLPDSWKSFNASINSNNNTHLTWSIAENADTKQYIIEHSPDGHQWERLAEVQARGKNGEVINYTYEHNSAVRGKHYYRIARIQSDGRTSYSDTKMIYGYGNVSVSLWPNPAQEVLQVETSAVLRSEGSKIFITDQTGSVVAKQVLQKGINYVEVKMLKPGHYLVTIESPNGEKLTHKFLKN